MFRNAHEETEIEPFAEANTNTAPETRRKVYTAALLGVTAVAAFASEKYGLSQHFPKVARLAADSSAHPVLGYVGGWMANALTGNPIGSLKAKAGFIGATIADFATESAQSVLIASPQYVDFMSSRNLPETAKDYAFALGGLGLYLFQSRRPQE